MGKRTKTIVALSSPDVWLSIGDLAWSRLQSSIKTDLLQGVERIAEIRAAIAHDAPVRSMPLVEVVGEIWATSDGIMPACATPLRQGKVNFFGARLSVLTAMCEEVTVVRRILVHEFLHCFREITELLRAEAAGISILDHSFDPLDAVEDAKRLANPSDWFGIEDAATVVYHNDPRLDLLQHRFGELKQYFRVLDPKLDYKANGISIPQDVRAHVVGLLQNLQDAQEE